MKPDKQYTVLENYHPSHSKNHRLVRAAYAKGLTRIEISHYPNAQPGGGWYLYCDQFIKLHIGYTVNEAEARINKI